MRALNIVPVMIILADFREIFNQAATASVPAGGLVTAIALWRLVGIKLSHLNKSLLFLIKAGAGVVGFVLGSSIALGIFVIIGKIHLAL